MADIDMGIPCLTNEECSVYCLAEDSNDCYCDTSEQSCYQFVAEIPVEAIVDVNASAEADSTSGDLASLEALMADLESRVALLQNNILTLESDSAAMASELSSLTNTITALQQQVDSVNANFNVNQEELGRFSTGLAGMQETLNATQSNLSMIFQQVASGKAMTTIILVIFLLLAIAAAVGIGYYVTNGKFGGAGGPKVDSRVLNYITSHIRRGKKYPHIKEQLLKAGWKEEHIEQAYKTTMKENYQRYLQRSGTKPLGSGKSIGYDQKKIFTIMVITAVLIIGIVLVVNGTVGKAIEWEKLIGGEVGGRNGKVSYQVECTPPHILAPDGDACCLDENNNLLCDSSEREVEETVGSICTDNNQCPPGQYCLDGSCGLLSSLYTGAGDCSRMCNYYALTISTSDGEIYTSVKPKTGSYTATGVLEWKVLAVPDYCKGEPAVVPFRIIRKEAGEIINEEVLTLRKGETKQMLVHPEETNTFSLKIDRIKELCPE
ncbi:MAG TPA: hypothetical protein VJG49_01300 [Candidatus Nanoarchaeia archaeon]|nr:hypothetical protein [Candidatus Nanoarchaeia archaeon]